MSEVMYKQRVAQQKAGQDRNKNTVDGDSSKGTDKNATTQENTATECEKNEAPYVVKGYRMIHVETVKNGLRCKSCEEILSLHNITKETLVGFASIWHVKCDGCLLENLVYTSPKIRNAESKRLTAVVSLFSNTRALWDRIS